jgi:hypothetical protein
MEREPHKDEVYQKPETLEIARVVRAIPWKIASSEPTQDKDKRSESAALGRQCELHKGRTFTVCTNAGQFAHWV